MKYTIIAVHAVIGWGLCGAAMGLGMAFASLDTALIIHLVAAPIIFICLSLIYFTRFGYTSPLTTAFIFLSIVILLDVFVVALLIEKSFEMFTDPMGTWIPFMLIFASTYSTGRLIDSGKKSRLS